MIVAILVLAGWSGGPVRAEATPAEARNLAVDFVWLRGGGELRGAILARGDDKTVLMAVRREWLRKADPRRLAVAEADEAERSRKADDQLLDRLDAWIARRPEDLQLKAALMIERRRCQERLDGKAGDQPPPFLLLELEDREIRNSLAQDDARRKVAHAAWDLGIENVETQSAAGLLAEVKEAAKTWPDFDPDLSDQLPPLLQAEEEWEARVALWEYAYRQACDFQGTDAFVVRSDSGVARPDLAALLKPTLEGVLQSELGDLLNPDGVKPPPANRWRQTAIDAADKSDLDACRVTRININAGQFRGSIAMDFLVRLPGGRWETVWQTQSETGSGPVDEVALNQIRNDPQVKSIQEVYSALGAEGDIDRALEFGAGVQVAQKRAESRFETFRSRYLRSLSGPPLRWARSSAAPAGQP